VIVILLGIFERSTNHVLRDDSPFPPTALKARTIDYAIIPILEYKALMEGVAV